MSSWPLVSVVVPTHNRARLLVGSLQAILGQSYRHLELIVVDDGSTDETASIVTGLRDPRLRYVCTRGWGGPARPRNVGVKLAHGTCVAFCDDDDLWHPEKLEQQVALLEARPEVALVYVLYAPMRDGVLAPVVLPKRKWRVRGRDAFRTLYLGASIPNSGVVVRTAVVRAMGGFDEDRSLIACEDSDLWIRIARAHAVDYVPDRVLLYYRVHDASVSRSQLQRTWRAVVRLAGKHRRAAGPLLYLWATLRYTAYFAVRWIRGVRR